MSNPHRRSHGVDDSEFDYDLSNLISDIHPYKLPHSLISYENQAIEVTESDTEISYARKCKIPTDTKDTLEQMTTKDVVEMMEDRENKIILDKILLEFITFYVRSQTNEKSKFNSLTSLMNTLLVLFSF